MPTQTLGASAAPHHIQPAVQMRLYEAGCELEQLAGLLATIADQLGAAHDPHGITANAAMLARLGLDRIDQTLTKLLTTEDACRTCWDGREAIAEMLLDPAVAGPFMGD
jgi:hypothetical protein